MTNPPLTVALRCLCCLLPALAVLGSGGPRGYAHIGVLRVDDQAGAVKALFKQAQLAGESKARLHLPQLLARLAESGQINAR